MICCWPSFCGSTSHTMEDELRKVVAVPKILGADGFLGGPSRVEF
ncbi:unnamed protein product [Amoebophrya sp. A25]|nr:unnamed protein product [Amoebophrya sp. A25]|eukprot:GSA25T00012403001.1